MRDERDVLSVRNLRKSSSTLAFTRSSFGSNCLRMLRTPVEPAGAKAASSSRERKLDEAELTLLSLDGAVVYKLVS